MVKSQVGQVSKIASFCKGALSQNTHLWCTKIQNTSRMTWMITTEFQGAATKSAISLRTTRCTMRVRRCLKERNSLQQSGNWNRLAVKEACPLSKVTSTSLQRGTSGTKWYPKVIQAWIQTIEQPCKNSWRKITTLERIGSNKCKELLCRWRQRQSTISFTQFKPNVDLNGPRRKTLLRVAKCNNRSRFHRMLASSLTVSWFFTRAVYVFPMKRSSQNSLHSKSLTLSKKISVISKT